MINEKIKDVLRLATLIVEHRNGDINTEDGCLATTDTDTMIALQIALCDAFDTQSDDVHMLEIEPKINAL